MNIRQALKRTFWAVVISSLLGALFFTGYGVPWPNNLLLGFGAGFTVAMLCGIGLFLLPALFGAVKTIFGWEAPEEEVEILPEPAATRAKWHGYAFGAMAFCAAGALAVIVMLMREVITFHAGMPVLVGLIIGMVVMGVVAKLLEPPELRAALQRIKARQSQ